MAPPISTATNSRTLRVLVVDDSQDLRDVLQSWLTAMGHRPVVAGNAAEALAAARQRDFDLVITDLFMHGGSGFELIEGLHAVGSTAPVIVMSGTAEYLDSAHDLALARGYNVPLVIHKPFRLEQLDELMRAALASRQPAPAQPVG